MCASSKLNAIQICKLTINSHYIVIDQCTIKENHCVIEFINLLSQVLLMLLSLRYLSIQNKIMLQLPVGSPKAVCLFTITLTGKTECVGKVSNLSVFFLNKRNMNSKIYTHVNISLLTAGR